MRQKNLALRITVYLQQRKQTNSSLSISESIPFEDQSSRAVWHHVLHIAIKHKRKKKSSVAIVSLQVPVCTRSCHSFGITE